MSSKTGRDMPTRQLTGRSPRKHHWWRWILAGAVALIVLVVLAAGAFIKLQKAPAPLTLPTARASTPASPLDGSWAPGTGSVAGFRVRESVLGFSNDVVGRTNAITGTMVVTGGRVTSAMIRIGLATIKVGGKAQPQFTKSLGTRRHPAATFTLTRPIALSTAFASGAATTVAASGHLAMNGTSHLVTFMISGRRDGSELQAAGSIPIAFSEWDVKGPAGFGFFGGLMNHGSAEFLLVLHHLPEKA